jgi:hypothetical protein
VNQNLGNRGDSLQNSNNNLYLKIGSRDPFNLASNPGPEGSKKFSGQDSPDPSSMSQHLQASIGQQHPNDYSIRTIVEQEGDSRLLETHQDLTSLQVNFLWGKTKISPKQPTKMTLGSRRNLNLSTIIAK